MAFNEQKFLSEMHCPGFDPRARTTAAEFKALHAELAELRAACLGLKYRMAALEASCSEERAGHLEDTPDAPARETGWAVVNHLGDLFTGEMGFMPVECAKDRGVLWFGSKEDASVLQNAVAIAGLAKDTDVALLYKDTPEEADA